MDNNKEGPTADPVAQWAAPGGQTGLEEPMWQLGLNNGSESYPERPDESDCVYYLKTGFCGFGDRCRYNHPPDSAGIGEIRRSGEEHLERMGQPVCQYYMRTGTCKFGVSCKYHHPRHGGGSAAPVNLNIYGYPLRPGEKECTYYVKTGQCKFGVTCKFHHPQPAGFQVTSSASGPGAMAAPVPAMYPTLQSPSVQLSQQYVVSQNWPVGRPALFPGSYIPGAYGPMLFPPGMVTVPSWTPYPAAPVGLASSSTQLTYGETPGYGISQLSSSASAYAGQYLLGPSSSSQKEPAHPERPGQPECQHYMKTGDCKYGSSCKYHHPLDWSGPRTNSDGLPFHPNVVSKDGASSKLDHPMGSLSHSPSTSSLTGVPVAPYSVGSSAGTLAPAFSSSDLRPDLVSGSIKDASTTQMPSINSSSDSVGEAFSNSIPSVAHSTVQQHGPGSTPASSSTANTGQGVEVHPSS